MQSTEEMEGNALELQRKVAHKTERKGWRGGVDATRGTKPNTENQGKFLQEHVEP